MRRGAHSINYDEDTESVDCISPSKKIKVVELSSSVSSQPLSNHTQPVSSQVSPQNSPDNGTHSQVDLDQDIFAPLDHYRDPDAKQGAYLWSYQDSEPYRDHPHYFAFDVQAEVSSLNNVIKANYKHLSAAERATRSWLWADLTLPEMHFFVKEEPVSRRSSENSSGSNYESEFDNRVKQS